MADKRTGRLAQDGKFLQVKYRNKKDKERAVRVPCIEISRDLLDRLRAATTLPPDFKGKEVELEEKGNGIAKVTILGQTWQPPENATDEPFQFAEATPVTPVPQSRPKTASQAQASNPSSRFHNPYNFVPALPRDRIAGELGDREPLGHHVLHADHYSGVIRVKMTVKTPLLLPNAAGASVDANDHKSFPVRVDAEGEPYIPPTSIKGMLRAAYEAVTNSRLAVFVGHDTKLQFRKWNQTTNSAPKVDHPVAPCELLPESLKPAYWIDKLSPADRVFGWVRQSDQQRERTRSNVNERIRAIKAYRGNVRIGPVTCESNDAIESFGERGLPLAILGQPKPQQARFYVAKNQNGEAQDHGLTKEQAGYRPHKGLRGARCTHILNRCLLTTGRNRKMINVTGKLLALAEPANTSDIRILAMAKAAQIVSTTRTAPSRAG